MRKSVLKIYIEIIYIVFKRQLAEKLLTKFMPENPERPIYGFGRQNKLILREVFIGFIRI